MNQAVPEERAEVITGTGCVVDSTAVLGKYPMQAPNSATVKNMKPGPVRLGDNVQIGAGAIIYAGAWIGNDVLIADLAQVRENVTIGNGTIVGCGVVVENGCGIGSDVKLQTRAYIAAYSIIERDVFIAPGVVTSNDSYLGRGEKRFKHYKGVTVRRGARIGINATILPAITIGEDSVVAAGSVVTKDVPDGKTVMGVPARMVE